MTLWAADRPLLPENNRDYPTVQVFQANSRGRSMYCRFHCGNLAKTCNFGQYLDKAIQDQFVCGLHDKKCKQELLAIPELTVHIAQQRATTAEVVSRETVRMQEATPGKTTSSDVHKLDTSASAIVVEKQDISLQ